jgi:hypothetical protein
MLKQELKAGMEFAATFSEVRISLKCEPELSDSWFWSSFHII